MHRRARTRRPAPSRAQTHDGKSGANARLRHDRLVSIEPAEVGRLLLQRRRVVARQVPQRCTAAPLRRVRLPHATRVRAPWAASVAFLYARPARACARTIVSLPSETGGRERAVRLSAPHDVRLPPMRACVRACVRVGTATTYLAHGIWCGRADRMKVQLQQPPAVWRGRELAAQRTE